MLNSPKATVQTAPAQEASPKPQQSLTDRNLSYNISDEKLLTAAAQLVDVYNKRSKASATITLQKKPTAEPRNRSLNNKQPLRSPFPTTVPNFVVTKITEKSRNVVATDKGNAVKLVKGVHTSNVVKTFRKQDEIEKTKRMIEQQRQKSLHIFNACAMNKELHQTKPKVFDANNFQVKSLSISHNKVSGNSSDFIEHNKSNRIDSKILNASDGNKRNRNEPVILNFRTKIHDSAATKPKQLENMSSTNGRRNYQVLEISPLPKNSMERGVVTPRVTTDRYYKTQLNPMYTAVKPLSMTVTKVYSRFPANSMRYMRQRRQPTPKHRAPLLIKYPSMSNISNSDKSRNYFLTHRIDANQSNALTSLTRWNSCILFGGKSADKYFEETFQKNQQFTKLFELCSNVVQKMYLKGQTMRRKRGRPRKKIYKSLTRDLLNSPDFSLKSDIFRLHEMYYASKFGGQTILNKNASANPRRSKRFALLSIEPVLPDMGSLLSRSRERSPPISSFQYNRAPLKTYSRTNLIQPHVPLDSKKNEIVKLPAKQQFQLLNIEPLSSTSQIDMQPNVNEEVSQSTEYIIDSVLNNDEYDETDAVYIEYLEDNDEIESPAYEPHISETIVKPSSTVTGEADSTFKTLLQHRINSERFQPKKSINITHNFSATTSINEKGSPHIEIKYLNTNESDAHSTTDSIHELFTVCDDDRMPDFVQMPTSQQKKTDLSLSPIRKSTRKRKIPSEFPNFAIRNKKVRS